MPEMTDEVELKAGALEHQVRGLVVSSWQENCLLTVEVN
jgi:hypothetical protein